MKVNICDICDKIIGHKQGVTLKASDHTLTRIIDNHVISNMKRKYKVHICDDRGNRGVLQSGKSRKQYKRSTDEN